MFRKLVEHGARIPLLLGVYFYFRFLAPKFEEAYIFIRNRCTLCPTSNSYANDMSSKVAPVIDKNSN